jgi:septal ring factor EnvC (AmiA/AmiB activator)
MMRFLGLVSLGLAATLLSGCGETGREGPIVNVVNRLNTSVEQVKTIDERLKEAKVLKKQYDEAPEAEKKSTKENLDKKLSEVVNSIDDLKVQAQKLLEEMRRAERAPPATTEEEKKELALKYRSRVAEAMKQLSTARLELAGTFKDVRNVLEPTTFNELDQRFKEAEGEFENLARLK